MSKFDSTDNLFTVEKRITRRQFGLWTKYKKGIQKNNESGFVDSGQHVDLELIDREKKETVDNNGRNPTVANKMFLQWCGDV